MVNWLKLNDKSILGQMLVRIYQSSWTIFKCVVFDLINRKARRKDKGDVGLAVSGGPGLGPHNTAGGGGGGGGGSVGGVGSSALSGVSNYDADHKLYLEETVLERKVPEADLRQLIDLPPGLDLNEWLASHSKLALFFLFFCF